MRVDGKRPDLVPAEFEAELKAIVRWWMDHARDGRHRGVYGEISDDNTVSRHAEKGAILQARALWFFSEAAGMLCDAELADAARAQCGYFVEHFLDRRHGGVVWCVRADGTWSADRKQVYAQAFAIYALCAFARAFHDGEALETALDLARTLEKRAWDHSGEGYVEAFARDWSPVEDVRLSERDLDAPKTMNTHLHVLEAYTALHRAAGRRYTEALLDRVLELFRARFVRPGGRHLALFYSMSWECLSRDESYGHDVEASWLLCEAADALGDPARTSAVRAEARTLAAAALDVAVDGDGGLAYEWLSSGRGLVWERHWWAQAEALVGFYNAYQITGESRFREATARVWSFIKQHQIHQLGEWRWFADVDAPAERPYKAGFWKGPYHNGRAMMEMVRRLERP